MRRALPVLRVLVTFGVVAAACLCLRWLWLTYEVAPWTRDGRVRADVVEIAPDVSGLVESVAVVDNAAVHKGQLLFVLDQPRYRLALAQADALVRSQQSGLAEAMREQRRNLALTDLVPRETVEQAAAHIEELRGALAQAIAARDVARLNLARTRIVSPASGIATNVELRPGDYASAGHGVLAVVDRATLRVEGYFEETKLRFIHVGDAASIRLMGSTQDLRGHVESIAGGIVDRERATGGDLLPDVNPTFSWVRLAQRIPVRVALDYAPSRPALISGRTATITIHPRQPPRASFWPW